MSGETEGSVSAWTIDSLREHLTQIVREVDQRYEQRFEAQELAIKAALEVTKSAITEADRRYEQRFQAQESALAVALDVTQEAIGKAENFGVERYRAMQKEFHEHLEQARDENRVALAAAEKAILKSENATEKAITKAEESTDKRFECVAADTPVLCADLTWRPAGELLVGDELIGFDEKALTRRGRRYRRSVVTANSLERDTLLLVTTSDGSVRCNPQHPWLVRKNKDETLRWVETAILQQGWQVVKPLDVWQTDRSWEAGWLAGMYDGEGCLSVAKGRVQLTMSQRESPTSDLIASAIKERLGRVLTYRYEPGTSSTPRNTQPFLHFMAANRPDTLKMLGSVRPPRLLAKADAVWEGAVLASHNRMVILESVESVGTGLIAQLSTSTHTYVAGGFAMHNSVNEFRSSLADQAKDFMPRTEAALGIERNRAEADGGIQRNTERVQELTDRFNKWEGRGAGLNAGWVYLLGALAAVGTLISIVLVVQSGPG